MWGDQAEWVIRQEYFFWDKTNYSMKFLLYLIVFNWTKLCSVYLWNDKSDSDGVFSKTKLWKCVHKWITKLKLDSDRHKTHFAWSHHIFHQSLSPKRTTSGLVKKNILSFLQPIRKINWFNYLLQTVFYLTTWKVLEEDEWIVLWGYLSRLMLAFSQQYACLRWSQP